METIYVGYQNGLIWGCFENETAATDWVDEFPDCRKLVKYKKVE